MSLEFLVFAAAAVASVPAAFAAPAFTQATVTAVPPVPGGREYAAMTPEQRYALRLRIRTLPENVRKPWLAQLRANVDTLPDDIHNALHDERNAMDARHGTRPAE